MNKAEFIDAVSKSSGFSKGHTERWLEAFMKTVADNIDKEEGIKLVGFGTFTTLHKQSRSGRHPKTREIISIPAKSVPVFRPGVMLRNSVETPLAGEEVLN